MRGATVFSITCAALLANCTGDPVGEAPADGDVDSALAADVLDAHDGDALLTDTRETRETSTETTAETDVDASLRLAGKPCGTTVDCDPGGTSGAQCLTAAPTPMCYGAKCSPASVEPTLSPCPDDGVCLDDGAGGGICVPLCYFDGKSSDLAQGCLGKNACWFVGTAIIGGKGYAYGRCEGRCGSDVDCPSGTLCQNDGACVVAPKVYAGAIGDACLDTDDGTKCACVWGLGTKMGYCSKFCRVGDGSCPSGYTCDADVPASFTTVPAGVLGNCLKDCGGDGDCTNAFCEQHAAVATKTCQPGAR